MNVANKVRQIYDRCPYPPLTRDGKSERRWLLPPMEWIGAMGGQSRNFPRRILVAGCGTGAEAFALRRRFPGSTIVAADFCARSISLARQARSRMSSSRPIRFVVADLTSRDFTNIIGRDFDFVSCHGVLSYIPQPARALRHLAQCLRDDGALYLGVNGTTHVSVRWRPALAQFGFDLSNFKEGKRVRNILQIFDELAGDRACQIPQKDATHLASDLFGPLIHNWPLLRWIHTATEAGLCFRGSYGLHHALRPIFNADSHRLLIPRSRTAAQALVESLSPSAFHQLIFARCPEKNPPWQQPAQLLRWRAQRTTLYTCRYPKRRPAWNAMRPVSLKSKPTNTLVDLRAPEWEVEILRRSNGAASIAEVLSKMKAAPPLAMVRDQLYSLYQLAVLNLSPPA